MANRNLDAESTDKLVPDSREQAILAAIIQEHLVTGEAIGSQTLSDRFAHAAGWSAPTIRNVMGRLEECGLVEQPHTSAGRIPTDRGYRFYVDHMVGNEKLSRSDLAAIRKIVYGTADEPRLDPDRLMQKASHVLSALSDNVGIVVSPSLAENRLQHIEFVQLPDDRILVVLVSGSNIVHDKIIRLDEKFSQDELERTARYLNTEFSGKSLSTIRSEIIALMQEEKALYDRLLRNAMLLCERSLEGEEAIACEVYVDGASNILLKPEFADTEKMRALFRMFEEKSRLVKLLNECVSGEQNALGKVKVVIGMENTAPSMKGCAVITAPYRIGEGGTSGTLGVVGPTRIEYARMMAVVNYLARFIERELSYEGFLQ
jgi:heat-inducible transcriptional repressor